MNAHERAEKLFKKAEKLGMEKPSESMVAEAIHDAECDALNFPHRVEALGGPSEFIMDVKAAVGRRAEHAANDMDHYGLRHNEWYEAVQKVRKHLNMDV